MPAAVSPQRQPVAVEPAAKRQPQTAANSTCSGARRNHCRLRSRAGRTMQNKPIHAMHVPAVLLGLIERHVGVLQKLIGGLAIGWSDRDADASPDHDMSTLDIVRVAQQR